MTFSQMNFEIQPVFLVIRHQTHSLINMFLTHGLLGD